eukprot:2935527-Heterocapsa_arctica.AAC.1
MNKCLLPQCDCKDYCSICGGSHQPYNCRQNAPPTISVQGELLAADQVVSRTYDLPPRLNRWA